MASGSLIDLTHTIRPDMSVLPGDPPPEFSQLMTVERDLCAVQSLKFNNHLGTHLDAPAHFIPGGATIEQIPLDTLMGEALVLDFSNKAQGEVISRNELAGMMPEQELPSKLLIRTGWDKYFHSGQFFQGFPVLSPEAAELLASLNISLLGLDTPSPSPLDDPGQGMHKILLGAGLVILESAANLERIPSPTCQLTVLPLPFLGCSGSPCRAVARISA